MTTGTPETIPAVSPLRPLPPLARPVGLIALAVALVHLAASRVGGYWFDEVYMLAIGRYHLSWGSADQPPLAPALAWLADVVAPGSIPVLRLPSVLATVAAVVLTALIARELGGGRRAQSLACGAQATGVWPALAGHWLTPYGLEPAQWLLLFWLLVRWIRRREDRLLLAVGLVVGVSAETKFQVLLLGAVLVGCVLVCGPRTLLTRPLLWVGALVALALVAPTLWWQARWGWPQLRMGSVVASEADALYGGRPGIAALFVLSAGVLGAGLGVAGLCWLLRAAWLREFRFLGVAVVALSVFFVATGGRPYYLAGGYGLLSAAGAVGWQRAGWPWFRWLTVPAITASLVLAGGLLVAAPRLASAPVGLTIASRASGLYHALPADQRARTVLMGQTYIVAAYLDGYGPRFGLPAAYSGNRSYGYFPAPPETADTVLLLGSDPDQLVPYFDRVEKLVDGGPDASAWLCTGRRVPWSRLWPALRTLGLP